MRRPSSRNHTLALTATALVALWTTPDVVAVPVSIEVVALTGESAPGTGGETFSNLNSSRRRLGRSAFNGSATSFARGVWAETDSGLALVARNGSATPGVADASFSFFNPIAWDGNASAFVAGISGSGVSSANNLSVWAGNVGSLNLLAREGSAAPGTGSSTFQQFSNVTIDGGVTAFEATLTGTGIDSSNDRGIWADVGGTLQLIAREGAAAPGGGGAIFTSITLAEKLRDGESIGFVANLSDGRRGFWTDRSGAIDAEVLRGDPAPARTQQPPGSDGTTFASVSGPVLDEGAVAFNEGAFALWSDRTGALEPIAELGAKPPGVPGGTWQSLGDMAFDNGGIVFEGVVAATPSGLDGIWSDGRGPLQRIALEGDTAPGTGGLTFLGFDTFLGLEISESQVAFAGILDNGDGTSSTGIWAEDTLGNLELVARTDSVLTVAPGDERVVSSVFLDGFDGGELSFAARFTDGSSGLFLAEFAPVQSVQDIETAIDALPTDFLGADDPTTSGVRLDFGEIFAGGEITVTQSASVPDAANTENSGFLFQAFENPIVYDISPEDGFAFDGPVTLVFKYDRNKLLNTVDELDLVVWHFSNGILENLGGLVDTINGTITVTTNSFSEFLIAVPAAPDPTLPPIAAPAPATLALLAVGILGAGRVGRKRSRA